MTFKKRMIALVGAALLTACSSKPAGVGSYLVSFDDEVAMMVQIASIEDGRVHGTYSVIFSDENGKTTAGSRPISGTIEGNALNLSIENGAGLSLVTGVLEDDALRLTFFVNGESSQFILAKDDASKFEELVNASRVRAAEKQKELENAAALKNRIEQRGKTQRSIDQLADTLFAKAEEAEEKSRKVEVVIAGYRAAQTRTGKMQSAKRTIDAESYDGSYRIREIDYEINSISNDMKYEHSQVQSYMQSLNEFMADATVKSSRFLVECQADQLLNCSRLSAGLQSLRIRYQQFQTNHAKEKAAYNGDRRNTS